MKVQRDKLKQYQKRVGSAEYLRKQLCVELNDLSRSFIFAQLTVNLETEQTAAKQALASGNKVRREKSLLPPDGEPVRAIDADAASFVSGIS